MRITRPLRNRRDSVYEIKRDVRRLLTRYWFTFDAASPADELLLAGRGAKRGCGVTAFSYDDALTLVQRCLFHGEPAPPILSVLEDVDIRALDQGHVVPNIEPTVWRGIWFPACGTPLR